MSTMTYNGIELDLIKTRVLSRTPVLDPGGNCDYMYTRFVLEIDAYLNPTTVTNIGALSADTDIAIRHALMQPRGKLVFGVGAVDLINMPPDGPPTPDADAGDGPKPLRLDIRRIDGTKTFLINFSIETYINECPKGDIPLLTNRWHQSHDIDERFRTTRTTEGIATFRRDFDADLIVDYYRSQILPRIPVNFKRERINIRVNPNGNAIHYVVVDRELLVSIGGTTLPGQSGVVDFQARLAIGSLPSNKDAMVAAATGLFHASVWGHPDALRVNLITWALRLAYEKLQLNLNAGNNPNGPFPRNIMISEHLHEKYIELHIETTIIPNDRPVAGVGPIPDDWIGKEPIKAFANDGSSPQPLADSGTRGSWPGVALAAKLKSACEATEQSKTTKFNVGAVAPAYESGVPPVVTATVTDQPPHTDSDYKPQAWHTDYKIESFYDKKYYNVMGPVTGALTVAPNGDVVGPPPVLMALAAPTSQLVIRWEAERAGLIPMIPNPFPVNQPNLVLVHSQVTPRAPILLPDGQTYAMRISGEYRYIHRVPTGAGDQLATQVLPSTKLPWGTSYIYFTDYQDGIIGP